ENIYESKEKVVEEKPIEQQIEKQIGENIIEAINEEQSIEQKPVVEEINTNKKLGLFKIITNKLKEIIKPSKDVTGNNELIINMAMISFIRMILNPILIFLIGRAFVSLPDVSNTIELVFEQFNISEENIPMVLLLLNGIIILIFSGIIGSINYYKSYLERTYGSNTEIIGKKYIDRVCNLGRISMNNFILYAIGVFGTLLNSNANISQVSQLSLLYTVLLIPYSILVMVDYHHYLPLPQGALLYIYLYGCLSSKINSKNLYQEILSLPETIKSIRQNSIHL
ncbi:hypothetical protein U3516DRAFT_546386, partial [Neocallimastix sp. 'constans']